MTGLHPRRANRGRLLHENMTTLAEVARSSGYRTTLTGKWHCPVTKPTDKNRLPTRRGFDDYYGLAAGCCNYFNPAKPFPDSYRHVVDFMPTLLDVAGAAYPEERNGVDVLPTDGLSLLPVFEGKERVIHKALCWYLYGNRAVRQGKWKLLWGDNVRKWELFDLELDRTETGDLAARYPERVKQMQADWLQWAKATGAPLKGTGL